MTTYASANSHISLARLGPVGNAQAYVTGGDSGTVGDVSLGRYTTIISPFGIPTQPLISHTAISYTVLSGETLTDIANKFGVSVSDIRWSNTSLISSTVITTGQQLLIPPIPGVVVVTRASDTIDALGTLYQVDPQAIVDFNRLRSTQLSAGMVLVIPGGTGGAFPPPPALWQLLMASGPSAKFSAHVVGCCLGPYNASRFPVGWCTWYVATKFPVTWSGDAGYWYNNAAAKGYPVGPTPKVGAIMVTWESWAGHVAFVESVNADGSWTVSEMNWLAFDVIDVRTIKPGQLGSRLEGFIY